jgi:uncharacterized protein YgbK (DUF1537 family)
LKSNRWLILADDLTGAADAASAFRQAGYRTLLRLGIEPPQGDWTVIATDLDVRELPEGSPLVQERVREALSLADGRNLFLKIDSTMRGPIRALTAAVAGRIRERSSPPRSNCILVCPAFPAHGRTTRGGVQYLRKFPVVLSGRNDETLAALPELFGDREWRCEVHPSRTETSTLERRMTPSRPLLLIGDAESNADLDRWAKRGRRIRPEFWVGSAGLSAALARQHPLKEPVPPLPRVVRAEVVAGSAHPRTHAQLDALELIVRRNRFTGSGQVLVYRAPRESHGSLRPEIARDLAKEAAAGPRKDEPTGWILTGGATAGSFLRALGVNSLEVAGEVAPGIPYLLPQEGQLAGSPVITKSGGFGEPDAMIRIVKFLLRSV